MKKIIFIAVLALVSTFSFAQQVAYVNFEELIALCPEADKVRADMDEAVKVNSDVFEEMKKEYQTKIDLYNKNKTVWSASILKDKETELAQFEERINSTYQMMQVELQQKQQELMIPVQKKVNEAIAQVAKEKGVVYVLYFSALAYIDESKAINLTPDARKVLNIPADRTMESLQREMQAAQQAAAAQQAQ